MKGGSDDDSVNMPTVLKVVTVGESAVGKTQLLKRFGGEDWNATHNTTVGIDFIIRTINGVRFQCWDTAGQERFRSHTISMFKNANVVLFCFDMSDANVTLSHLLDYYLLSMSIPETAYRILVGTKCDLRSEVNLNALALFEECKKYVQATFFTSAKENYQIDEMFVHIISQMRQGKIHMNQGNTPIVSLDNPKKKTNNNKNTCC